MKLHSCNIVPILRVATRYQLDSEKLFTIILDFLSHRREEILNAQLSRWFSPFDGDIKRELKPILYELISELNYTDNLDGYYIKNNRFYIKDQVNDYE
jgi:hypothetical protein